MGLKDENIDKANYENEERLTNRPSKRNNFIVKEKSERK